MSDDGQYTDANDDPIDLPATAIVGIPHPIEIDRDTITAFGRLFIDYELIAPFAQLDREVYQLSDDERQSTNLQRWKDLVDIPPGKVLSLTSREWKRGPTVDHGLVQQIEKMDASGIRLELLLRPGIRGDNLTESEPQCIEAVLCGRLTSHWREPGRPFSILDDISASELIRDVESLR